MGKNSHFAPRRPERVEKCIFCKLRGVAKADWEKDWTESFEHQHLREYFKRQDVCIWCKDIVEVIFKFYETKMIFGKHTFKKVHDAVRMFQIERALDGNN